MWCHVCCYFIGFSYFMDCINPFVFDFPPLLKVSAHLLLACLSRLHALLQEEEEQLLREMEEKQKEATAERQAWMREQVKALRGKREEERKQMLAERNEQLFR